jgi:hypothetical protein
MSAQVLLTPRVKRAARLRKVMADARIRLLDDQQQLEVEAISKVLGTDANGMLDTIEMKLKSDDQLK